MCVQNLKSIALPILTCIIGGTKKFLQSLYMRTPTLPFLQNFQMALLWMPLMNVTVKLEVRSFIRSWVNRGSPKICGGPWLCLHSLFPRKILYAYRIVHSMCTRFPAILPHLFSSTPLCPTPPLVSTKFPHVLLGLGGSPFGCKDRRCWANCLCNSFQDFQPMWSQSTNVTDRRTDRQTDHMRSQDRALH